MKKILSGTFVLCLTLLFTSCQREADVSVKGPALSLNGRDSFIFEKILRDSSMTIMLTEGVNAPDKAGIPKDYLEGRTFPYDAKVVWGAGHAFPVLRDK